MTRDDIIRMAREAGMERVIDIHKDGTRTIELPHPDLLERFAALVAAAERKRFYGQDKPAQCVNGCPSNQICDYCQIVAPVREMIAAEREACAKVCDEFESEADPDAGFVLAAAIRARSNP